MGAYLSHANLTKDSHDGEDARFRFGSSAMQGWRIGMEDAHVAVLNLDADTSFFAVYDGHGGQEVARFCARHLHREMLKSDAYRSGDLGKAITNAYLRMDDMMKLEEGREELRTLTRAAMLANSAHQDFASPSPDSILDAVEDQKVGDVSNSKSNKRNRSGPSATEQLDDEGRGKKGGGEAGKSETRENVHSDQGRCTESEPSPASGRNSNGVEGGEGGADSTEASVRARDPHEDAGGMAMESTSGASGSEPDRQGNVVASRVEEEDEDEEEDEEEDPSYLLGDEDDEDFWQPDEVQPQLRTRKYIGPTAGCTAVSAIVQKDHLLVANAGDSRCVLSREGQAMELSRDHKPHLPDEFERISTAGGHVTEDGRVNGCLNLSRAIGDMEYKQSEELPPQGQMVTAFPELSKVQLQAGDEFLVLACDGVWDVMSSQQVVDFVRERLQIEGKPVSEICEEMFEKCVAPSKGGDGLGMDNMSAIIVVLKGFGGVEGG